MPQTPISKLRRPFFCCPFFFDPQVRINKMVNEQCWLQPLSFRVNLKDTSSNISTDSSGLYFPSEYILIFSEMTRYPTMVGENFQINLCCSDYWKMYFPQKKNKRFLLISLPGKLSPSSYNQPPGRGKLLIPQAAFFRKLSSQHKGGGWTVSLSWWCLTVYKAQPLKELSHWWSSSLIK